MVMAYKHLQTSEIASNSNTHLVAISCNKYKQMRVKTLLSPSSLLESYFAST